MEISDVIFRKWKDGQIIALFPHDMHETQDGCISSYMHIGQHSSADYHGVVKQTKLATEVEYADLKKELEDSPYHYKLNVIRKINMDKYREQYRKTWSK